MKKILVIVGHQNVQYNSITSLHGNTGTVGELEINIRIADRLASLLRTMGFEVVQSDANTNDNPAITKTDFDLALALHCDMDTPNDYGGGMIASGDPSVDSSWQESARIKNIIESVYFTETKIVNKNYTTTGMTKYYMWQYLSDKTPCVLIEMGQAKDPHDSVLLANTDLIANALLMAICLALNVPYTTTTETTTTTLAPTTTMTTTSSSSSTTTVSVPSPDALGIATAKLKMIHDIVWGSGWWWTRIYKIRELLPK